MNRDELKGERQDILFRLTVLEYISRVEYREVIDVLDVTFPEGELKVVALRGEVQRIQRLRLAFRYWRDVFRTDKCVIPRKMAACVLDDQFFLCCVV